MTILDEAAELINGQRAQTYGDVSDNFERIAKLWGAYRNQFFDRHDVAMFMILVKVARQAGGYHRDSAVDIAGYAALDEKIHLGLKPRVWQSLTDVPKGVSVHDTDGDCVWTVEGPVTTTENDQWGPFTEILDMEQSEG